MVCDACLDQLPLRRLATWCVFVRFAIQFAVEGRRKRERTKVFSLYFLSAKFVAVAVRVVAVLDLTHRNRSLCHRVVLSLFCVYFPTLKMRTQKPFVTWPFRPLYFAIVLALEIFSLCGNV